MSHRCRQALRSFLGIFILALSAATAQTPNLKIYSTSDGLPQGQVFSVYRDPAGFLWLGTYGGLSRYDGRSFSSWTAAEGLSSNTIYSITGNSEGRLIIGTANGVCFLETEGLSDRQALGEAVSCVGGGDTMAQVVTVWLHRTAAGAEQVWSGSRDGATLFQDNRLSRRFTSADGLPSTWVLTLTSHRGRLYVGTDAGLAVYSETSARFESVDLGEDVPTVVTALASSERGLLVGGGDGRMAIWNGAETVVEKLPPSIEGAGIRRIVATPRAGIWLATLKGAVHLMDGPLDSADVINRQTGISQDRTHDLIVDFEDIVWIGTDSGLVKRISGPLVVFGTADGVPDALVRAVEERPTSAGSDNVELWLGTRRGVFRSRGTSFEPVVLSDLQDPRVYAIAHGTLGEMWIGATQGLVRWFPERQSLYGRQHGLPQEFVLDLVTQASGDFAESRGVWVGTRQGLIFIDEQGQARTFDHSIGRTPVLSLLETKPGELWVGKYAGGVELLRWRAGPDGPQIFESKQWSATDGLTDQSIWSMVLDPHRGRVWLGTNGDGSLGVGFDKNREELDVLRLTATEGLTDNFVWQVISDSNRHLWLFTNRGLDRFRLEQGKFERVRHYDLTDGLPDLEGAAGAVLEDSRGRLWFGSTGGVVRYDPTLDRPKHLPPRVLIQEVVAGDGRRLKSGQELGPDVGSLTVKVTALSFRNEERVRFRYRLIGGDDRWSRDFRGGDIHLVGLSPGEYKLEVAAFNESGIESRRPATFDLSIRPSFWSRTEVWGFGAALTAVLLFGLARLRLRHLERERRRLETLVTSRTLELQRQNQSLEREIEERAKAENEHRKLEGQLRQSEKMEAVGRLAGGVAHDFNNLLTTISGYSELLSGQVGQESPMQKDLKEIRRAAKQAARLTQQLLAFSHKQEIEPTHLGLNGIVESVSRMLRRLIGEHIEMVLDLEAKPDTVLCDRGQLEQILMNLVLNARDSIVEGGRIRIRTRVETLQDELPIPFGQPVPAGTYVLLEVDDSGHGMQDEVLSHIFEPFFTTKKKGEGTGLGLATVYGAVRQNKGYIDVDSEPGRGTRFSVRFPVAQADVSEGFASGTFQALPEGVGYTVLVVEDEEGVRSLMCGILSRFGYSVLPASNGKEAIEVSGSFDGKIDLLLTDMVMPELDGRALAERLSGLRPTMEVLFVSGYPDDYLSRRGLLPQGKLLLNKPFSSKRLAKAVRRVLHREDGPSAASNALPKLHP